MADLSRDPNEQHNLAALQPERCARLRQRLVAWTDANRRQYDKMSGPWSDPPRHSAESDSER